MQYKEASEIFLNLMKDCFKKCVNDFKSNNVSYSEVLKNN
jgi:hypothetical protein